MEVQAGVHTKLQTNININENQKVLVETFHVEGMTCASCAVSLQTYLEHKKGITDINVSYPNQSAKITYNPGVISVDEMNSAASEIGYNLVSGTVEEKGKAREQSEKSRMHELTWKLIFSILFSLPVFLISMFFYDQVPYANWILMVFSFPVLFWSGSEFFINGFKRARHLSANMDTLVALSTGIAFLFSLFNTVYPEFLTKQGITAHVYYESAVIIITFILTGRFLEERAKGKTSLAIKKLIGLKPDEVTIIFNGEEKTVHLEEVVIGDMILIRPGNRIPVDGKVKRGESFVDESMITGEPMPVKKEKNDKLFAGTINQSGPFRMIAEKVGNETLLARIIQLVQQAQSSKPPVQKLVDKIAGIFVPVVIVISIITSVIWYFAGPEPSMVYSFLILITVLIIACPCALGLATPTALMVGIGKGAGQGILIRDAHSLEIANKIDTLILDKTGTITEGKPGLTGIKWLEGIDKERMACILKVLEAGSDHPVAIALVQGLNLSGEISDVEQFENIPGRGVRAIIDGEHYFAGNYSLMEQNNVIIDDKLRSAGQNWLKESRTVIYFSNSEYVLGVFAISDAIKESSTQAIREIHDMGIKVVMLTGDNEQTAESVATRLGIDIFKSELLPSDKGRIVRELQNKGQIVAMTGDGINDSEALAQADVSIAMGSGSDIAMESADITLMHSDLREIPRAILLSKATLRTIKQNLFWAFIYNIIAIPIAAGILYPVSGFLLNPMIAGGAMAFSSVSVVTNSLRLNRKKI